MSLTLPVHLSLTIVTREIPAGVIAVGNPCRVLRKIGEHEKKFFYKQERIDWENLLDREED